MLMDRKFLFKLCLYATGTEFIQFIEKQQEKYLKRKNNAKINDESKLNLINELKVNFLDNNINNKYSNDQ